MDAIKPPKAKQEAAVINSSTLKIGLWISIAVLLVGNIVQAMVFINHDVGWVLYSSGRLLDGGTFGRDIIAANPPLIWWVSSIPNAFASIMGIDAVTAYRFGVFLLSLVVLIDLYKTASGQVSDLTLAGLLVIFAAFISFGVNRDFGQREHLTVLLCIPYLTRAARLAETGVLPIRASWLASIGVGIGVAFKPHFFLLPLFVELFVAFRLRRAKQFLRADVLISGATIVVYVLAVLIFARPYLTEVIPSISEVYWGFSWPISHVIWKNIDIVLLVAFTLLIVGLNRFPTFATTIALASLAFLCAALLQKKGYSYHLYPASAFALIALVATFDTVNRYLKAISVMILGLAVIFLGQESYVEIQKRSSSGTEGKKIQAVIDVVQEHVPIGGNFLAISTHPFPGFPVTNYASRDWEAASNSRIGLPAIVRMRVSGNNSSRSDLLNRVEVRERQAMLTDLSKGPDLVLFDVSTRRHAIRFADFDFLSFYLEDPTFLQLWEKYEEIDAGLSEYRSFKLKPLENP